MNKNCPLRSLRLCEREKIINLLRFVTLGFLVPITLSFVVYAGFNTGYTSQGLTLPGFIEQYFTGVYRYRILGRSLLLGTYDLVKAWGLPLIPTNVGDSQLYSAYFYLNTLFLCLTCATLFIVLDRPKREPLTSVDIPLLFLCALIAISQFVVVPYDTLSYFWLALAAWVILRQKNTLWDVLMLCALVVLCTLTRESSILILSFYFAVNCTKILSKPVEKKLNSEQLTLLVLTLCFGLTYLGLRITLGFSNLLFQNLTLVGNSNLLSWLGLLFLVGMTFLLLNSKPRSKESLWFTLTSLPYLLPLLLVAVWWEIRLWVPFLMLLLILALRNEKEISQSLD